MKVVLDTKSNRTSRNDCAIYANATYIVTEDTHFNELKQNPYSIVNIKNIQEFLEILKK